MLGLDQRRGVQALDANIVSADARAVSLRTLRQWLTPVAEERAEAQAPGACRRVPTRRGCRRARKPSSSGGMVLVAEDNETNRMVIRQQLALIGVAADIAVNGRDALECWRANSYALVLTDLHMPEMDGYELAAAIRAEELPGQRTPILALTANALRSEEQRCLSQGMDACLTKPIRLPELQRAIEEWLGAASVPDLPPFAADVPPVPAAPAPSQPAPPAGSPPADLSVLRELVGDDAEVVAELLQNFRDNSNT